MQEPARSGKPRHWYLLRPLLSACSEAAMAASGNWGKTYRRPKVGRTIRARKLVAWGETAETGQMRVVIWFIFLLYQMEGKKPAPSILNIGQ
jgi:hypothetical protein